MSRNSESSTGGLLADRRQNGGTRTQLESSKKPPKKFDSLKRNRNNFQMGFDSDFEVKSKTDSSKRPPIENPGNSNNLNDSENSANAQMSRPQRRQTTARGRRPSEGLVYVDYTSESRPVVHHGEVDGVVASLVCPEPLFMRQLDPFMSYATVHRD